MPTPAPQLYEKRCPTCGTGAMLDTSKCIVCGHVFTTQFDTPVPPPIIEQPSGVVPPGWAPQHSSPVQQAPYQQT